MPLVGWRRIVRLVLLALLGLLVLVQFVPYGRDHGTLGHGRTRVGRPLRVRWPSTPASTVTAT